MRDTYFSCAPGQELLVLRFLHSAIERGKAPYMLNPPGGGAAGCCTKILRNEAHLTLEFMRFEDTGEALVAVIEPQNFVLPLYCASFLHALCLRKNC